MKKHTITWLIGIIIVLLIINIGFVGWMFMNQMDRPVSTMMEENTRPGMGMRQGDGMGNQHPFPRFMMRRLDFNEDQRSQMQSLTEQHRNNTKDIRDQMMNARRALIARSLSGEDTQTDSLIQVINSAQEKLMRTQIEHIREMMSIGDEDQQQQMQQMLHRMGERIGNRVDRRTGSGNQGNR